MEGVGARSDRGAIMRIAQNTENDVLRNWLSQGQVVVHIAERHGFLAPSLSPIDEWVP